MAISVRENQANQLESGHLKDAFWLVSEALYEVSKVLNLPAELIAETLGLDGVRSKYTEIRLTKEEQRLDVSSRAQFSGARDDRENRDRKERDFSRLAVMALLNNEQRQRLGGLYDGIEGTRGKGADIGGRLAELEGKLERWHDKIMLNTAYKDGKAYFRYEDGRVVDESGNSVPPEQAAGIDFAGKTSVEEKAAYDAARTEVDELKEGLGNALGDLDALEADLNRRIAENPDKADEIMDEVERSHQGIDRRMEDIEERAKEVERSVGASAPSVNHVEARTGIVMAPSTVGSVEVFKLP